MAVVWHLPSCPCGPGAGRGEPFAASMASTRHPSGWPLCATRVLVPLALLVQGSDVSSPMDAINIQLLWY